MTFAVTGWARRLGPTTVHTEGESTMRAVYARLDPFVKPKGEEKTFAWLLDRGVMDVGDTADYGACVVKRLT